MSQSSGSSYMGNCAISSKQRPQAFPSMMYVPFMTKILLYVQLATFCSHKTSQNMGLFYKKPFRGGGGGLGQYLVFLKGSR